MDPEIRQKIDKLKEYWFDDDYSLKWVKEVEEALRRIIVKEELSENKGLVAVLDDVKSRIKVIDTILTFDEDLTDVNRKLLFREKKVHQFYLNRFEGKDVDEQFKKVGKLLDEELEKTGLQIPKK